MILTIDVGNSVLSFGLFSSGKIKKTYYLQTKEILRNVSYLNVLKLFEKKDISHVVICSVVDEINEYIFEYLKEKKVEYTFLNKIIKQIGIKTLIKGSIGADRLVNIFFCLKFFKTPFLIIDLGTATTFDYINNKAIYEGGLIFPGIDISLKALNEYTSKLPIVKFKKIKSVVSNNTKDAISSGFYWGYLSMIEGVIEKIKKEKKENFKVILTGGNSKYFLDSDLFDLVDKNLTIKSLYLIYKDILKDERQKQNH